MRLPEAISESASRTSPRDGAMINGCGKRWRSISHCKQRRICAPVCRHLKRGARRC